MKDDYRVEWPMANLQIKNKQASMEVARSVLRFISLVLVTSYIFSSTASPLPSVLPPAKFNNICAFVTYIDVKDWQAYAKIYKNETRWGEEGK